MRLIVLVILTIFPLVLLSQENKWDNQIYMADKVTCGSDKFKFSGEIQIQLRDNNENKNHAVRYVLFINKKMSEKLIINFAVSALYKSRKEDNFATAIQFFRVCPGIDYKLSEKYQLNFSYYISGTNTVRFGLGQEFPLSNLLLI